MCMCSQEAVEGKVQAEKELAEAQSQVKQLSHQVQHLMTQQHESASASTVKEQMQEQVSTQYQAAAI